jgi:hypothetical protein
MLFRIKAGDREFYLVRASERPAGCSCANSVNAVRLCGCPIVAKTAIPTSGAARMADIAIPWPHRNPSARSHQTKRITASDSRESPTRICKKVHVRAPISGKSNRWSSGDFYCRSIASE